MRALHLAGLALACVVFAAPQASAQKVASKYTEVPQEGFKFKALRDFDAIPVNSRRGDGEAVKFGKSGTQNTVIVYSFGNAEVDEKDKKEGASVAKKARPSIVSYVQGNYRGFSKKLAKEPSIEEEVEHDGMTVTHRQFQWSIGGSGGKPAPVFLDIWSFPMSHADIHICYFMVEEASKKADKVLKNSALSFEMIDRVVTEEVDTSKRTFEDQMAWAQQEADKTDGWEVIGTPSKRFVILTSSTKKAFVKEVIKRLEVSRDIYEVDFPPPADFKAVSVVRICKDREEFKKFAGVPDGVAGFFDPSSVELVLYDNVETNRNSTYAVVSHEAFHQYCHFLFNQSEAHRWYDEGHGDYYGGLKISGKRGKITPKMPAGLDRLSVIREMVSEETYKPLSEHLYFNHREWQGQGPSNVSCYAQSWSIIYMLRQGALRQVNRKVWKDEYADIIPNYVKTLNDGFLAAYDEVREERIKRAKKKGKELSPEELVINRFDLDPRAKDKIWDEAMKASWGKIDLDQFEKDWVLYVDKFLKSK